MVRNPPSPRIDVAVRKSLLMSPEEAEVMFRSQLMVTGLWISTGLPPSLVTFHTTCAVKVWSRKNRLAGYN